MSNSPRFDALRDNVKRFCLKNGVVPDFVYGRAIKWMVENISHSFLKMESDPVKDLKESFVDMYREKLDEISSKYTSLNN